MKVGIPCLTTVQAVAAAVQGIEQLVRDEVGGVLAINHQAWPAGERERAESLARGNGPTSLASGDQTMSSETDARRPASPQPGRTQPA